MITVFIFKCVGVLHHYLNDDTTRKTRQSATDSIFGFYYLWQWSALCSDTNKQLLFKSHSCIHYVSASYSLIPYVRHRPCRKTKIKAKPVQLYFLYHARPANTTVQLHLLHTCWKCIGVIIWNLVSWLSLHALYSERMHCKMLYFTCPTVIFHHSCKRTGT